MCSKPAMRSGASTARQSAHIPPSEVPTIGTRSRPSASSSEVSWATACTRNGSAAVVEGVAEAEPGEVEGDQTVRSQIRHQRRPRRSAHATTVHQAVARLQDAHSNRRISQTHAPARDLYATRGKQPALGLLERHGRVIAGTLRHGSVPRSSFSVLR